MKVELFAFVALLRLQVLSGPRQFFLVYARKFANKSNYIRANKIYVNRNAKDGIIGTKAFKTDKYQIIITKHAYASLSIKGKCVLIYSTFNSSFKFYLIF